MFTKLMKFSAINAVCDLHAAGKMSEADLALALTALDIEYYNNTAEETAETVQEPVETRRSLEQTAKSATTRAA